MSGASRPGTSYSSHAPGLAFVLLPGYAFGGYVGARSLLCVLVALAAVLLRAALREAGASEGAALATWAVVALTPPLSFYAAAIYPETAAFCAVVLLLWLRRRPAGQAAALVGAGVAGALVWLHPKFLPLGCVALALVLFRVRRRAVGLWASALFAAVVSGFLLYMHLTFGRATLSAGFGDPHLSPFRMPWGMLAQVFDRQWGLFAIAPVWMLVVPGVAQRLRDETREAVELLLLAAVPVAMGAAYGIWWGGACPPARFPLPALPALAAFLTAALPLRRGVSAALAGVGVGIVLLAVDAPSVLHNVVPGESGLLRHLATVDLNALFPSFFDARWWVPVLLTLSLTTVGAFVWRHGIRGLVLGAIGYALLAMSVRDRPTIEPRQAGLDLLWAWDRDNWAGPMGPPDITALALPLEMRGAPWTMAEGEAYRSRNLSLPPGTYDLAVRAESHGQGMGRLLLGARARAVPVAQYRVSPVQDVTLSLFLPVGAPDLRLEVQAEDGGAIVRDAVVLPREVAARGDRAGLAWPRRLRSDRYRLRSGSAAVTIGDDSEPEGDGFRLLHADGSFVVDGPEADTVTVHVRRTRPEPDDELIWGRRSVRLGRLADAVLWLPMSEGVPFGRRVVVVARLRAQAGWIRFFGERTKRSGSR